MVVSQEQLQDVFAVVRVLALGQSPYGGGIVLCSQKEIAEGAKVEPFRKNGDAVYMRYGRRGDLDVYIVEEGGDFFYAKYRSFKNKSPLLPAGVEGAVVATGTSHGSPEVEGYFRRLSNPLL